MQSENSILRGWMSDDNIECTPNFSNFGTRVVQSILTIWAPTTSLYDRKGSFIGFYPTRGCNQLECAATNIRCPRTCIQFNDATPNVRCIWIIVCRGYIQSARNDNMGHITYKVKGWLVNFYQGEIRVSAPRAHFCIYLYIFIISNVCSMIWIRSCGGYVHFSIYLGVNKSIAN